MGWLESAPEPGQEFEKIFSPVVDETYSHPQKTPRRPTVPPAAAPTMSIKPVESGITGEP
jgi:hypothetical protein